MALKPTTRSTGHAKQARRQYDQRRGSARQRGYTTEWDKASATWLKANPLCAECERHGMVTAAGCVDHIIPHRGNQELFWDMSNWQSLCSGKQPGGRMSCHTAKTARGE